jgi:hypothetical protein
VKPAILLSQFQTHHPEMKMSAVKPVLTVGMGLSITVKSVMTATALVVMAAQRTVKKRKTLSPVR